MVSNDYNDDYNDENVYDALSGAFAGEAPDTGLDAVIARGRRIRTRHRLAAAGAGTCATALMAAVGMLAPSSGAGTDVTDVGFSVRAQGDGVVRVSLQDFFDPAKLKSALARAGVRAAVQATTVDEPWPPGKMPRCAPTPGVTEIDDSRAIRPAGGPNVIDLAVDITPSAIPAGAVISIERFFNDPPADGLGFGVVGWSLLSGEPGKCVIEMVPMKYGPGGVTTRWSPAPPMTYLP